MANFGDLLGNFMRSGVGQSGQVRAQNALRDLQAGLGSGQG
ncbi:protein YebE, partial [Thiococcus pfennigii]|nr:protein YebE [Thiococcus pfennigii]